MRGQYILILVFAHILFPTFVSAQDWFDESTEWLYSSQEWGPRLWFDHYSYNRDTTINDLDYLIFQRNFYSFLWSGGFDQIEFVDSLTLSTTETIINIWESSITTGFIFRAEGDSFFQYDPEREEERTLFIFNTPIGSHWNTAWQDFSTLDLCNDCEFAGVNETQVVNAGIVMQDGQELDFTSLSCMGYIDRLYDKVGPADRLLPYWPCLDSITIYDPFVDNHLEAFRNSQGTIHFNEYSFGFPFGLPIGTAINNEPVNNLEVYPNPFEEEISINFAELSEVTLELIDLNGRVLFERYFEVTTDEISISTSTLNQGMYFLRLQSEDQIHTSRVFKR